MSGPCECLGWVLTGGDGDSWALVVTGRRLMYRQGGSSWRTAEFMDAAAADAEAVRRTVSAERAGARLVAGPFAYEAPSAGTADVLRAMERQVAARAAARRGDG